MSIEEQAKAHEILESISGMLSPLRLRTACGVIGSVWTGLLEAITKSGHGDVAAEMLAWQIGRLKVSAPGLLEDALRHRLSSANIAAEAEA